MESSVDTLATLEMIAVACVNVQVARRDWCVGVI